LSFAFWVASFGLEVAPSSQRSTCSSESACLVEGSRASTSRQERLARMSASSAWLISSQCVESFAQRQLAYQGHSRVCGAANHSCRRSWKNIVPLQPGTTHGFDASIRPGRMGGATTVSCPFGSSTMLAQKRPRFHRHRLALPPPGLAAFCHLSVSILEARAGREKHDAQGGPGATLSRW
jgi:hypothetical protein